MNPLITPSARKGPTTTFCIPDMHYNVENNEEQNVRGWHCYLNALMHEFCTLTNVNINVALAFTVAHRTGAEIKRAIASQACGQSE